MSIDRDSQIIIVPGRGVLNLDAERVNRAVMEYDERLRFGFNPTNQDWVIYIKMPRDFEAAYFIDGEPVYPVMGFGSVIPDPMEAVIRLRRADTMERGMKILDEMNKNNARVGTRFDTEASDATEETIERMEHAIRKEGYAEKYAKVHFLSKD